MFSEHDVIHNHNTETGKNIYRYPLIQFKLIDKTPCIIALTEKAIQVFKEIFIIMDEVDIEGKKISINEKDLKIENANFGFSRKTFLYEFSSPWLALNQRNYNRFNEMTATKDKNSLLKRILTGNILSMAKYLGCYLTPDQRIETNLNIKPSRAALKGKSMIGFMGVFKTNFLLPDHIGLGKSVSRGFGTIQKIL